MHSLLPGEKLVLVEFDYLIGDTSHFSGVYSMTRFERNKIERRLKSLESMSSITNLYVGMPQTKPGTHDELVRELDDAFGTEQETREELAALGRAEP